MKKILKNKKIIIYAIILIFIILALAILNNKFKIIEKITNGKLQNADEETAEQPLISYQVYDNSDESKIKTLVMVNNSNGIEYVEYPDGTRIEANNKQKVSLDYNMAKDENYTFKIKTADNENVQEQTVCINDEFINDNVIGINTINEINGYKILNIENKINFDGYKTYYKIGNISTWSEGEVNISLVDYDLKTSNLTNEDNTVTVSAKIENTTTKNTVILDKKFNIDTNAINNSYEAESIMDAVKKEEVTTGLYEVSVNDETYNLRVYSFNENLDIETDTTFGTEEDVATASEYAKNMIVLKVNGDLTIEEGAKLTAYASKNGYGGPKGMTIYCTGTIKNNGTIDMTARGAKAVGQNVYLFKNADNTYEYVPAVGATGAPRLVCTIRGRWNGVKGNNGVNRETGGGGTGAVTYYGTSGAGSSGTSYSGGSGGGAGHYEYKANVDSTGFGGAGGDGAGLGGHCAGGAGNPGGLKWNSTGYNYSDRAANGTGGLLIIYANVINNYGSILSNGSNGGSSESNNGGSSGGGSINIFYKDTINNGTINSNGGIYGNGGSGGTGSISIGQIIDGTYKSTYTNY